MRETRLCRSCDNVYFEDTMVQCPRHRDWECQICACTVLPQKPKPHEKRGPKEEKGR